MVSVRFGSFRLTDGHIDMADDADSEHIYFTVKLLAKANVPSARVKTIPMNTFITDNRAIT